MNEDTEALRRKLDLLLIGGMAVFTVFVLVIAYLEQVI